MGTTIDGKLYFSANSYRCMLHCRVRAPGVVLVFERGSKGSAYFDQAVSEPNDRLVPAKVAGRTGYSTGRTGYSKVAGYLGRPLFGRNTRLHPKSCWSIGECPP
jgi:hypothetical protein